MTESTIGRRRTTLAGPTLALTPRVPPSSAPLTTPLVVGDGLEDLYRSERDLIA